MDFLEYARRVIAETKRLRPGMVCRVSHLVGAFELRLGILEAAQRIVDGEDA